MDSNELPPFNPINKADLEKRAEILAEGQEFAKDSPEEDSFRHAYTAAMMTRFKIGDTLTEGIGYAIEGLGIARNFMYGIGSIFDSDIKVDSWDKTKSEMFKDLYNNEKGIEIGKVASDEPEIIKRVADQIRSGEIIVDSSESYDRYNKEFGSSSTNFVASDVPSRTGGIDTGSLIRALSGGKGRMSSKQIFSMSAAAFAQEIIKSNRRALENDLLDILTNGNGKNTLPQVGSGNPMASLTNTFGGLIDNLVGSAMNRRKTRVSNAESERSIEAGRNWNPSRSQQQAMLASWATQGNRNN